MPLGLLERVEYAPLSFALEPEDVVVFYSDGINENFNVAGEEFGRGRLRSLIAAHGGLGARQIADRIFEEAHRWGAGRPISDDRTAVVLKVLANGAGARQTELSL